MQKDEKSSNSLSKKIYVLDTNIIVDDPYAIKKIDGDIIISDTVLEELEEFKKGSSKNSRNVREFVRLIDKGAPNVSFCSIKSHEELTNDQKIINVVKNTKNAILLTNDLLMSLIAKSLGIPVERYILEDESFVSYSGLENNKSGEKDHPFLYPNQYLVDLEGLYKADNHGGMVRLSGDKKIWNVKHKNLEQRCAIDALLDDKIKLVTLSGKAGTGKTLLAIAAGLEKCLTESKYECILVSRPIVPMGHDIGYLPGELKEKLDPWMHPIYDNINYLFKNKYKKAGDSHAKLALEGFLKLEALTFIRGRSIPNNFIIIDEAQNLTKHEVKTILSRAGHNTKIVMTGDVEQIDHPKLSQENNGLSYVIEKFKTESIAAHITLTKCERSELAGISSRIL